MNWISVKSHPVPHGTPVIVTDGTIWAACELEADTGYIHLHAVGFCGHDMKCDIRAEEITHWMPEPLLLEFDEADHKNPEKDTDICLNCECFRVFPDYGRGLCQNEKSYRCQTALGTDHPTCEHVQWRKPAQEKGMGSTL